MNLKFKLHPIWWTAAARRTTGRVILRRQTYISVCVPPHINDRKMVTQLKRIG
jgi:hypothetical protein